MSVNNIATITNVALLHQAMTQLQDRTPGLPGLGVLHGPSGYGKSKAACWCSNRHDAFYVQCQSLWNRRYFLESILHEMGIVPGKSLAAMSAQISTELLESGRPLIIDEADWLAEHKQNAMMIMDLFEASQGSIVLIGEERLPAKLAHYEKIHNRILTWVPAQPANMRDILELINIIVPDTEIDEQLLLNLLDATKGVTRRISTSLATIRNWAADNGVERVTVENYTGTFFTSQAPRGRS